MRPTVSEQLDAIRRALADVVAPEVTDAYAADVLAGVPSIVVGILGTALLFWPHERLGLQEALGMLAALSGCLCAAINLRTLLRPNYKGFASRLALLPLRAAAMVRRLAGNVGEMSMVDGTR